MTLDISHLTLFFMATVCSLAMAFVWMFFELERRFGKRLVSFVHVVSGVQRNGRAGLHRKRFD